MSFTQKQPCLGLRLVIPAELLRAVNLFYDLYDEPEIITVSTVYSVTPCQGGRESGPQTQLFSCSCTHPVFILPPRPAPTPGARSLLIPSPLKRHSIILATIEAARSFVRNLGNSLAIQQLGDHASTSGARVRSLVGELRSQELPGTSKKKKKRI